MLQVFLETKTLGNGKGQRDDRYDGKEGVIGEGGGFEHALVFVEALNGQREDAQLLQEEALLLIHLIEAHPPQVVVQEVRGALEGGKYVWHEIELIKLEGAFFLQFFSQLPRGFCAAVVAPARRAKHIHEFVFKRSSFPEIAADVLPLVEYHVQWIVGADVGGEPETHLFVFCFKRAKQAVPDDEHHAHVFVQVLHVAGVVHPVVGWRGEEPFERPELAHRTRMDEDPVDLRGRIHEHGVERIETNERQRNEVEKAVERLEYRGTEAYRQVELFRRVMRDMHGPKEAAVVVDAMQPVEHEVLRQQQRGPVEHRVCSFVDAREAELVKVPEHRQAGATHQDIERKIKRTQVNVRQDAFGGIVFLLMPITEKDLDADDNGINRNR